MPDFEPLYLPECAEQVGLDGSRWDVAIEKRKLTGGRRIVAWVRDRMSGRALVDAAGGRITKGELDRLATRMAVELANQHMVQD